VAIELIVPLAYCFLCLTRLLHGKLEMTMFKKKLLGFREILLGASIILAAPNVFAEVVSSSPEHYELRHEASSSMAPEDLWKKLSRPSVWWHPDHTYSGDSSNLVLELKAGGHWREQWGENSVLHGVVLNVDKGKILRLDAPFGPLQGMAVNVVWTIKIQAQDSGSLVVFEEVANGVPASKLGELAKAVDSVKVSSLSSPS